MPFETFCTLSHCLISCVKTVLFNHRRVFDCCWKVHTTGYNKQMIYFIKSILKSLVILAIWLALRGAIYSRITLFFCSKSHLFFSQWEWDSKRKQPIRFQGYFNITNKKFRKIKDKKPRCFEFCNYRLINAKTLLLSFLTFKFNYSF